MQTFTIQATDETEIFCYKWLPEKAPVAVVQIAHGMAEHAERYADFAKFMNQNGFAVYANNHRGHKNTAKTDADIGFFAHENGWQTVTDDLRILTEKIQTEQKNLPIFMIGHSMGSMLIRTYITKYHNKISGVVLSGTSGEAGFMVKAGKFLAKTIGAIYGKKTPSKFLNALSFGAFNKPFKPNRTLFDWLSRDNEQVDKYINDPFCGAIFTNRFFYDMLSGLDYLSKTENIQKIDKNLPIFLIAGDADPVGDFGKGVKKVFEAYKNVGIKNLELKLYAEGRHEILNETNRQEVYNDILKFLKKN